MLPRYRFDVGMTAWIPYVPYLGLDCSTARRLSNGHSANATNHRRSTFKTGTKAKTPAHEGYPALIQILHAGWRTATTASASQTKTNTVPPIYQVRRLTLELSGACSST